MKYVKAALQKILNILDRDNKAKSSDGMNTSNKAVGKQKE